MMVSGIMTPKGAEDFVAPAALKDDAGGARSRGYRHGGRRRARSSGATSTPSARDAFDLQRVQTEEALYLLAARGLGPLLGDVAHARQAAALLLALHGPGASRRIRAPGRYEHGSATSTSRSTASLARYPRRRAARARHVVLLSDHGSAPLHTYFCVMNWLADDGLPGAPAATARRAAASPPSGSMRKRGRARAPARRASAGCRGSCRAALKGAVPQALTSFGKVARPHRLEPDAGVLPVGPGQRPLGQPARPRARGHRRAGRRVRARRRRAARAAARLPRPAHRRAGRRRAVHRREDIYHGPHADGGPDLLVETGAHGLHGRGARAALADAGRAAGPRSGPATMRATAS